MHGEVAGLKRGWIEEELKSFFTERRFFWRARLSWSEALIWLRGLATPTVHEGGYYPHFAWE